jgi:SNF2-related domain/Helicase conserved C-terminal domain
MRDSPALHRRNRHFGDLRKLFSFWKRTLARAGVDAAHFWILASGEDHPYQYPEGPARRPHCRHILVQWQVISGQGGGKNRTRMGMDGTINRQSKRSLQVGKRLYYGPRTNMASVDISGLDPLMIGCMVEVYKSMSPKTRAEGASCVSGGHVSLLDCDDNTLGAKVGLGAEVDLTYDYGEDPLYCDCNCTVFAVQGECMHLAAVIQYVVHAANRPSTSSGPPRRVEQAAIGRMISAGWFSGLGHATILRRLALFLPDVKDVSPHFEALCNQHHEDLWRAADSLLTWVPPEWSPDASNQSVNDRKFQNAYTELAQHYREACARLHHSFPLPTDARFPGFQCVLTGSTIGVRTQARYAHKGLDIELTLSGSVRIAWSLTGMIDSGDLLALQIVLQSMLSASAPLAQALRTFFSQDLADILLARTRVEQAKRIPSVIELGFRVAPSSYGISIDLMRRLTPTGKLPAEFTGPYRQRIPSNERPRLSNVEQRALAFYEMRGGNYGFQEQATDNWLLAFLEMLVGFPRVYVGKDTLTLAPVTHTTLQVRFDPEPERGVMVGSFSLGEDPLPIERALKLASTLGNSQHCVTIESGKVQIVHCPTALRPWLKAVQDLGPDCLTVPERLFGTLREQLLPIRQAGAALVPRALMGEATTFLPQAALSIDWDTLARVTIMVEVCRGAPLLLPGEGSVEFTFAGPSGLMLVERSFDQELACTARLGAELEPFGSDSESPSFVLADTDAKAAFLAWLAAAPASLRIETRMGKKPKAISFQTLQMGIEVQTSDHWFVLRTAPGKGPALGLNELLHSIRQALGYVSLGADTFVELSEHLRKQLSQLAFAATDLKDGSVRVPAAFGKALFDGAGAFASVATSVDFAALQERYNGRRASIPTPKVTGGKLRAYQVAGAKFMLSLADWAPGCILADDMGLGKTVQTAAFLRARATLGPQLIVAPASVSFNWKHELGRFAKDLRVVWFNEARGEDLSALGPGDVLVVSYGLVQQRPDDFMRAWATLVIDEAQYLKNSLAKRRAAIASLSRTFTVCLTGTPVENHLGELWSIVDLAFPGILGDAVQFRERFRMAIEGETSGNTRLIERKTQALSALRGLIAPFLLRRTRASVLLELPSREEHVEFVDLTKEERVRYESLRLACELQFSEPKDKGGKALTAAQQRIQMLAALTRLRQLACHPGLVEPTYKGSSSKLLRLVELCEALKPQFESDAGDARSGILVFSQFTRLLEKALRSLVDAGLRVGYVHGATTLPERKKLVDDFQADKFDVFLLSLTAAGTGLNLTRANYVVHLDPWWNPAVEEQATSRAHRMGQTRPVTVYRMVARGTVEEGILEMHDKKRDIADAVLSDQDKGSSVKPADLRGLMSFGADHA